MLRPIRLARTNAALVALLALALVAPGGAAVAQEEVTHWSYEGDTGPDAWADLDADFVACGAGLEQSPVDIPATAPRNPDDVVYAYNATELVVENNGHAIQIDYDQGSTVTIDGTTFDLKQFHFHSSSEHTIAGEFSALEMHLVHADAEGNLAVIGLLLVEGAANDAIAPVWDLMPTTVGTAAVDGGSFFNVADLLPDDLSYYAYAGSLTTPPCSEGVHWHMLATPIEISADQIAAFRQIHDATNRPTQPMNARDFLIEGTSASN